jgi:streptogramin lyase
LRQPLAGGFLVVMTLAACAVPAANQTADPSPSLQQPASTSAAPTPSGPPTVSLDEVAAFDVTVETAPDWPALLDGSLWVLAPDSDDPAVVRLDATTGAVQARIAVPGGSCEGLAAGRDSIWACTPDGMARIDPATNTIAETVPFQVAQPFYGRPAVGDDAIWSLSGQVVPTDIVRIDQSTKAVKTFPLGHSAQQIAYGLGYVWATVMQDGLLLRIDPASGEVTTAAMDLVDPYAVTAGAGHVWVGLQARGTDEDPDPSVSDLFRFDPATGKAVWVKGEEPFLMRLDPKTGEVEWMVTSDRGSGAIVIDHDVLWMTLWRDDAVLRLEP